MGLTILSVNSRDVGGGAERAARALHRSYLARGHDAWLATGVVDDPHERTIAIPNRESRTPWARVWMGLADALPDRHLGFRTARLLRGAVAEPLRTLRARRGHEDFDHPGTARLLSLASRRPDVLHLHNLHGGYFDLRRLPELSTAVPTVLSLHDAWLLSGHCAHSIGCERWEIGCGHCPALWIYPAVPRDRTALNWEEKRALYAKSALHIAVPSEWLAAKVRRSMLMAGARDLRVIPIGVDTTRFAPGDRVEAKRALGLDATRPMALTLAGSLHPRGWRDAEAFRGALERLDGASANAQWIAVGEEGADVDVGRVRVRRVGRVDDDARMRLWYQAADTYVHAAREDTFPLMVLEALACGTPVIASRVGGIPEQIRGAGFVPGIVGEAGRAIATGLLVPAHDADALARALNGFFNLANADRLALGANAAESAKGFDIAQTVNSYLGWMQELTGRQ